MYMEICIVSIVVGFHLVEVAIYTIHAWLINCFGAPQYSLFVGTRISRMWD